MINIKGIELEKGEQLVREISSQAPARIVISITLGLAAFAGFGTFYFYRQAPADTDIPWILIANAGMILILAVILAAKFSGSKSAVLTNKNLLVRTGRGIAALPLTQITGLKLGGGLAKKKVFVYAGGGEPALTLVVEDPEEVAAEIAACAQDAGAKVES